MAVEGNVGHGIRGQGSPRQIAALAARQHGVVSRAQLLGLGLGQGAIDHRVGRGLLHPVHRGAYAVGHSVLGPRGQWLAAVLAAGPGAVLSHSSAAALWGIRDAEGARPEVTVARRRRLTSVTTHRIALAEDEITINDGIPVTTPARTLLDLGRAADAPETRARGPRGRVPPAHKPSLPRCPAHTPPGDDEGQRH
jgi:predicted transcriptional regulator of viral defense system